MKTFLIALSNALLLRACQKAFDSPADAFNVNRQDTAKKYGVSFNLEDFKVSYGDARIGSKEMPAKDYLKYLFYGVYDSTGSLVNSKEQRLYSGAGVSGRFTDSLKAGRYSIVFVGSPDTAAALYYYKNRLTDALLYPQREVFEKKISLVVTNDTILNNVHLDRITGMLKVNVVDSAFPPNLQQVNIYIDSLFSSFSILTNLPTNVYAFNSYIYLKNDPTFSNPPLSNTYYFFGLPTISLKVTLRGYDKSNNIIAEKIVNNVFVSANKRTILTGRLFPSTYSTDIPLTIDSSYAGDTNVGF